MPSTTEQRAVPAESPSSGRRSLRGRLADLSVRKKILTSLLLVAGVSLATSTVALTGMAAMSDRVDHLYSNNVVPLTGLSLVHHSEVKSRLDVLRIAMAPDDAATRDYQESLRESDEQIAQGLERFKEYVPEGGEEPLAVFEDNWARWIEVRDGQVLPLALKHDVHAVDRMMESTGQPLISAAVEGLEELERIEAEAAKADHAATLDAYESSRTLLIVFLVAGSLAAFGLALLVAGSIVRPLARVSAVLSALGRGDLTAKAEVHSRDEVGRMAAALGEAMSGVRASVEAMTRSADELAATADELSDVSGRIAASAEQTSAQASAVSATAERVSQNVQSVAGGTEQMGAGIREIASSAAEAARVATTAAREADEANATIERLGEASNEIGNVVKMITTIAEQTNLLALNATIEAARAGESGKGFAVVAGEVKDLAQQTGQATDDIGTRVQAIQTGTSVAVGAISAVGSVIEQVNDYQASIADAVEEQSATTTEISRNIAEAAGGSTEIALSIADIAAAAQATSDGIGQAQRAATDLSRMSGELRELVARFRLR
ncbi:methyl-accepting chemotaxis protein [Planomonospora sp. ID91781]|uniref:methyl-accepting chemotaxis protein n=1 Tax=Planomonospora sp. ID91781 TaxID=2738135 RepID=UPI0018C3876B|nr:methyl-accepting chemotaxis protein [Planomonospora sp. ID91781]MBG0819582.1 methyl-accepting chemotaxis protein [Planomonospora sp. ID91781]